MSLNPQLKFGQFYLPVSMFTATNPQVFPQQMTQEYPQEMLSTGKKKAGKSVAQAFKFI